MFGVFTLMISEIVSQKVKISASRKTCDMSDYVASTPIQLKYIGIFSTSLEIDI